MLYNILLRCSDTQRWPGQPSAAPLPLASWSLGLDTMLTVCRLPFDLMHIGELALACCRQHIAHSYRLHGWFNLIIQVLNWALSRCCWLRKMGSCPVTLGAWLRSLGMTRHASKAAFLKIAIEKLIEQLHRVSSSRYTTSFLLPHDAHETWRQMAPIGCLWAAAFE